MIWMIVTSMFVCVIGEEVEVRLNAIEFQQGETIRLEVTGIEQKCWLDFNGIVYPLYSVDSSKVGLIGIPADFSCGNHELVLCGEFHKWSVRIRVKSTSYPHEKIVFPPEKASLLKLDITEERRIIRKGLKRESEKRLWRAVFIKPVDGEITSPYGARRNGGYHKGIDISAPRGTIVKAPAEGRITIAKDFPIHGKTVILDHGQGISTVYCHLDTIFVEKGEFVEKSSPIGEVGNTGRTTAPHLHWGIYVHGVSVDPSPWLIKEY